MAGEAQPSMTRYTGLTLTVSHVFRRYVRPSLSANGDDGTLIAAPEKIQYGDIFSVLA